MRRLSPGRASVAVCQVGVLLMALAMTCGCRSHGGRALMLDEAMRGEQPSFSDETSRELIRQTRVLEELRGRDYLVGADDVLEISIFEWEMSEETKTFDFRVAQSGVISLPAVGTVEAAGKTVEDIKKNIESKLAENSVLQNPRVAVTVKEFRSRRIAVVGAVNAPGVYAIHENVSTLMDMLTLAGGPSESAGSAAYVLRTERGKAEQLKIAVDLEELMDEGNFALNAVLQGGDVVYIPKAPLIYVYGEVQQPGGFPLRRSTRVVEALALAGGVTRRAGGGSRCRLVRRLESGEKKTIEIDASRIEHGDVPNIYLKEGDVLYVPAAGARNIIVGIWDAFTGIFTFSHSL